MLTSKQIIMLRPLSLSTDVCVQVDYTSGPSKSEVKISDLYISRPIHKTIFF